jgi:uncharacterized membrane protein YoaK (UPF0700 family)
MAAGEGDRAGRAERARGLLLAVLLAGLAGMVDAVGFLHLGHLFVSYMSGNSTQFAVALGRGRTAEGGSILWLIVLFVAGAAGGQAIAHLAGRRHLTCVLATVTALLTAAALQGTAAAPMVLAMGALNAAMHRAGNVAVSLTYVTGTLVKFGQGLGDFLVGAGRGWSWAAQALPWLGLVSGGIAAGAGYMRLGPAVVWLPAGMAGLLALWSLAIPDPQ